jgi:hypothetical protein
MIVTTRKHSYFINKKDLHLIELGSTVYDPEVNKLYMVLTPGILTEINAEVLMATSAVELAEAVLAGGNIAISEDIDSPVGLAITVDTVITNNKEISIKEDIVGDGVFKVTNGTLTLNGKGIINGVGKNDWNMAIWSTDNGKVIINDGYFTNEGATAEADPTHFDLIYASGYGQIEINGGEFKCETPEWTLNIKDKDRATASIVVKGGKFHKFNPANCKSEGPNTNFVAPGYKVVEETKY